MPALGDMLSAVTAAVDSAQVVVAAVPIRDVLEQARRSSAGMILVLAGPELGAADRAALLATIGPLAVELAPVRRIGALDLTRDASIVDGIAAARFLTDAESTTGQILRIG
ncbi:MAG: hypothetical protein V4564_23560 [Pseudomonadota bacterium]|uniref:Rossmann fold domain-containing protein n=1 Tax=Sphingomonas sp. ERG5 TaxID=1381597 RepID=UPI00126A2A12|nr:hypothetical protein [Sphingomonas sp. ERG5]